MRSHHILFAGLVAVAGATSLHAEEVMFADLLKRQEPGTPKFNCHDNCGTAISLSKQPNPCDNEAFVTDYNNCLQCSGPDNFDIWRMYGRTLSTAGSTCGLPTEPLAGKQPDVGPAVHVSSAAPVASAPTASAASQASAAVPITSAVVVSTTGAATRVSPSAVVSASGSGNASVSSAVPAEQTVNAATGLKVADAAVLGAVFVGAVFGL